MSAGARLGGVRAALLLLLCLAGCSGAPPAPIEDRGAAGSVDRRGGYTVRRGDTLYSIAFRFGVDYRRLAAANGIAAPYTIYPGQRLALRASPPAPAAATKSAGAPERDTPKRPAPAPVPPTAASVPTPAPAPAPAAAEGPVEAWRWPTTGRVSRRFSSTLHKGIDIAGDRGDAVRATAAGRVVYAGAGIAGYGELLIVRHNERFLSAYGHNDELLVNEGARVRAGQPIARRGSSGTDSVKLHFEIRRDGKPVDPLALLPSR